VERNLRKKSLVEANMETQQHDAQMPMVTVLGARPGRRITGLEARRLALEILHRAEEAREAFAKAEAERGPDWEGTS
jgi:hypothetical protein